MIPSRAFVLVAVGPVLLSLATLADRSLIWPMLGLDGAIVLVALLDAFLARKRLVHVERRAPRVMSIGKPHNVELEVRSYAGRKLTIEIIKKQDISLMPADLQKALSVQDLVDVVEYMTTLKAAAE